MVKRFLVKLFIGVYRIILFLLKTSLKLLAFCLHIFFAPEKESNAPSFVTSVEKEKEANRTLADTVSKKDREYYLQ